MLLTACLEAGELLQKGLHLILPGNILGLFLLLTLLGGRIVPLRWVESAARWLLCCCRCCSCRSLPWR